MRKLFLLAFSMIGFVMVGSSWAGGAPNDGKLHFTKHKHCHNHVHAHGFGKNKKTHKHRHCHWHHRPFKNPNHTHKYLSGKFHQEKIFKKNHHK